MDKDIKKTIMQTNIGLAALIDLLGEKGIITEDEYLKKYEQAKKTFIRVAVAEIKESL